MAIFIKFPQAKGNATAKGYEGWSEAQHIYFDISRAVKVDIGRKHNRVGGRPNFSYVTITKSVDNSSSSLFQYACHGKALAEIEMHLCATNRELTPQVKYIFQHAIVARHETIITGGGVLQENLQLSFTHLEYHYIGRDGANKAMSPLVSGFNLETAQVL